MSTNSHPTRASLVSRLRRAASALHGAPALLIALTLAFCSAASAQVYVGGTQTQIPSSYWNGPVGVASDTSGNIFVGQCQSFGNVVRMDGITHATSVYIAAGNAINGTALGCVQDLVIDSSNNLYIADSSHARIVKWSLTTNSLVATYSTPSPFSLTLDSAGNLWVGEWVGVGSANTIGYIPAGAASGSSSTTVIGGFQSVTGLVFDTAGNLYASDRQAGNVYKYTPTAYPFYQHTAGFATTTLLSGLSAPYSLFFDSNANLLVSETGLNSVVEYLAPGYTSNFQLSPGIAGAEGLGKDINGNLFMTAYAGNMVTEISPGGAGVGLVSVGTGSSTIAVNFQVAAGTTISAFKVVDQGITGQEFNEQSPDTNAHLCTTRTYSSTMACSINVTFTPKYPGLRMGAVEVLDGSGNVLATAYISGTGLAPLAGFSPGSVSTLNVTGLATPLSGPRRPVFDPVGNLYVADYSNGRVVKVAPGGTATIISTPGITLNQPTGVALDGAGNLFIANSANNRVVKVTPAGTASVLDPNGLTLSGNYGIAVDSAGNVYTADSGNNRIVVFPASGLAHVLSISGVTLGSPYGVAVDGQGNIFIADNSNAKVVKVTAGIGSYVSTGSLTLSDPRSVTLDSPGNIYVSDSGNNRIVEIPAGGGTPVALSTGSLSLNLPVGAAVSGAGDLYICDAQNNRIVVSSQEVAPTLTFTSSTVGTQSSDSPQNVTLLNLGNAPLSLSVPASNTNPGFPAGFLNDASTTCPVVSAGGSAATLAANSSCTLGIDFVPVAAGTNSGNVVLTDNSLGVANSTQSISVSGMGIASVTQLAFTAPPAPGIAAGGNAGSAITVAEENSGGGTIASATDTITLTVTGPNGYSQTYTQAAVSGIATFDLSAAALTTPGAYTYTASLNALTAVATEQVVAPSYTAPTQNVGTPTATQSATILLNSNFTLGSISVVTEGATGLDYAEASGSTCAVSTAYTAGQACTVNYTFTPTVPGERLGAILLYDSNGNLVSTTYLSGKGVAPEAIVSYPQRGVVVASNGQSLGGVTINTFNDAVIDGAGNIYAVDSGNAKLYKFTRTGPGAYTGSVVALSGVSLYQPTLLAIDGAGVIYTNSGSNIQSIVNGVVANVNLGSYPLGSYASGLAVDANGNLYVSDSANMRIVVVPSNGGAPSLLPHFPAGDAPGSLTIDPSGTVIYYEKNSHSIKSVTAAGAVSTVFTPPANTEVNQLNLDANGNVLWGDEYFGNLYSASQAGAAITLPVSNECGTHTFLQAGNGDYVATSSSCGNLVVYPGSTTGSLAFNSTVTGTTSSDSPQTVTLYNMGNAPLNIAVPASGSNPSISSGFALDGSSTCSTVGTSGPAATLAAGSSCVLAVNFSPTTVGANSGSAIVTDDSLNMAGSAQTISLSGTGLPPVTALGFSTAPASPIVAGSNAGVVTVGELSSSSTIVTTASDLITLTVAGPNGYTKTYTATAVSGVATFDLSGASLTTPGAYTYTATGATYTVVSTETVTKATPSITESSSSNPVFIGTAVTYTATVTGTAPSAPTGSVTFYDGATALGTATLNSSGVAVLTAPPTTVATHAVTAVYSGDTLYNTATSNAVSELAQDFNVAPTSSGTSDISVLPGGTAVFNLAVTPLGGATFPAAINLTQTGGPAGATATLSASSVASGTGATSFTLTVVTSKTALAANSKPDLGRKLAPLTLALLLLPLAGFRRFRKQWLRTMAVLLLLAGGLAATTGLTGCTTPSGYFGQAPKTFTYTVTGTSGSLTHSTSVTLTIE